MEETIQTSNKQEMKNEPTFNPQIKSGSMINETEGLIAQSEVIIAFYLLGIKPPWIMRIVYGD